MAKKRTHERIMRKKRRRNLPAALNHTFLQLYYFDDLVRTNGGAFAASNALVLIYYRQIIDKIYRLELALFRAKSACYAPVGAYLADVLSGLMT